MLTALLLDAGQALAQGTEPARLYGGAVVIDLPAGFSAMSEAAVAARYPGASPPDFVFAAPADGLEIGVSLRNLPSALGVGDYAEGMAARLPRLVDVVEWLGHGVTVLGDAEVAWLEFLTPAVGTDGTDGTDGATRYNYHLAALDDDRLLAVNVSCVGALDDCRERSASIVGAMILDF